MLSIEEKRIKIKQFCDSLGDSCYFCPLKGRKFCCAKGIDDDYIEDNYRILINAGILEENEEIQPNDKNTDIHLNGYIFDSLMYRYQLARERQLMYEIAKEGIDPVIARHRFESDVIRFRGILDEAIGEHD